MNPLNKLKGKDRYETLENYSVLFICLGAAMFSSGLALTVISPKGLSVILAMLGSLIAFLSVVVLIFTWLAKEIFGSE